MFNKINTIIALTLTLSFLFPISEIILAEDKFNHFPVYQTILFILPYLFLSIFIFIKYENSYHLATNKTTLATFIIGNILTIQYFFRLDLISIPISIKMKISSITVAIFSKGYAERQIIGFIAMLLLLTALFNYVYKLSEKENQSREEKVLN